MQITLNLLHVFHPGSDPVDNALALEALLELMVALNRAFLRRHPGCKPLYASGVRYGRTRIWEPIPALYARGYGDCKSLATARIAELRQSGVDCKPVFRWVQRPDGVRDFHILVQTGDTFEDPSKTLGMGENENSKR
jgi:hypothetical protein